MSAPSSARTSHGRWLFYLSKILGASMGKSTLLPDGSEPFAMNTGLMMMDGADPWLAKFIAGAEKASRPVKFYV